MVINLLTLQLKQLRNQINQKISNKYLIILINYFKIKKYIRPALAEMLSTLKKGETKAFPSGVKIEEVMVNYLK